MEFGRVYWRYHKAVLLTMMFKWGIFCTATTDFCLPSPCQHGSTCISTDTDYECICPDESIQYMGKNCEHLYDPCIYANCTNCISIPGSSDYTCDCPEGLGNPGCTQEAGDCASEPCDGVQGRCPTGYGGEDCQTRLSDCSDNPCFNNGTCISMLDGFACLCSPGFQGNLCEYDVNECLSQPCQNGAICIQGMDMYQCFCVPGFQGHHCEIDINECASQPCRNNGTCINRKDRYTCDCPVGFKGVNCEVEIDECEGFPCLNGGTCQDHVGFSTCECVAGYEGKDCEVDVDECASAPCLNRGACVDMVDSYACDCNGTGFTGEFCEEDILECASDPCQHGASCQEGLNQYTCHCWPGYEGVNCEVDMDECEAEPCENGGECIQRSDLPLYGILPELPGTFSYEVASGFLCRCPAGFTGANCSVNVDECESAPCQSGGRCEDLINAYRCVCPPGFKGVVCEINIDDCQSKPCQNGAICEDGINEYTCHCLAPDPEQLSWGGHDCDTVLTGCVDQPCQNGGTCLPLLHGDQHQYTCMCPPGFHGDQCMVSTTFSFSTEDYMLVEVPQNRTRREVGPHNLTVTLRFRTTLPDAVLFFRGRADNFFTLEMTGGNLVATAGIDNLELEVQLLGNFNDGLWHKVSVSVDDKLILILLAKNATRHAVESHKQLLFFHPHGLHKVYIGGAPQDYLNQTKTRKGFIGCMEDLLIEAQPILPQNISQDIQLGCEKTEWCHPHSCSQRGHCIDLWTEYRCYCHRPFYGSICAHEHTSWTFNHENITSFAAFPITQSHGDNITVSFFLRSLKYDGLVFQLKRENQAYFTVFLRGGTLNVAVYSSIRGSSRFITDGEKVLNVIAIQSGLLYINHTELLFSPGNLTAFEVKAGDMAYLGGLPESNDTMPWGGHFKGCLQDVRLDDTQLYMNSNKSTKKPEHPTYLPSVLHQIWEHCVTDQACRVKPCLNGGKCQLKWNDFVCSCPLNYTGKTCETRLWCVSDPCVTGSWCVDLPDGYECLANTTFENNALKYNANGSLSVSVTTVSVDLRTRQENGTVLRASDDLRFFYLGLWNSTLLLKVRSSDSPEVLTFGTSIEVSDGEWHRVEVKRNHSQHATWNWLIEVDGDVGGFIQHSFGNLDFFNYSTVWLAENFMGCLGEVRVGGVYLPLVGSAKDDRPQASRFVRHGGGVDPQLGCSSAPVCLSQPCLNNGSCQDLFNHYSCECAPGWEGKRCQHAMDECASGPCVHGTCRDLVGEYQCECARGYRGRRCEEDVDECQEQRCENGASCVNTVGGYTCLCLQGYSGPLCQWRYPPLRCEDVQCVNGGDCTDGTWGANCSCKPGYAGDRCEVDIDECVSNPCLNGATCMNMLSQYLCECLPGFSGANCETPRSQKDEPVPWLLVALPLMCLAVLLAVGGLVCMVLTARRKRQSEGTYSPSQQEVAGARLEMGSVLKVPPEERLI